MTIQTVPEPADVKPAGYEFEIDDGQPHWDGDLPPGSPSLAELVDVGRALQATRRRVGARIGPLPPRPVGLVADVVLSGADVDVLLDRYLPLNGGDDIEWGFAPEDGESP